MKFVLDPEAINHTLVKVNTAKLIEAGQKIIKDFPAKEADTKAWSHARLRKAKEFITSLDDATDVLYAPYINCFRGNDILSFEGCHRLRALSELKFDIIEIGVPKGTDITKLSFICE